MSDDEKELDSDFSDDEKETTLKSNLKKKQVVDDDDEEEYETENDHSDSEEDDNISVSSDELGSTGGASPLSKRQERLDIESNNEDEADDDDDYDDEDELKKLDNNTKHNLIQDYHPELIQHNIEEVEALSVVVRNEFGAVVDPLHKTIPILTKYEKARILGERAKQINMGAKPFVEVKEDVIDGYLIALEELAVKKIPFIIKRPLPNGGVEYWRLVDLEIL